MAYTTADAKSNFKVLNYSGNGSTNAVTGVGFQPDLVWGKSHTSGYSHQIYDSARGATYSIKTASNGNNAQETLSDGLTAFDSDGFTLGSNTNINANGHTITSWNWKAGSSASNSNGSITTETRVNSNAGFSIVKFTGNNTAGATIGHGLGAKPDMMWFKNTSASSTDWRIYFPTLRGNNKAVEFNITGEEFTTSSINNTDPTSTLITLGADANVNGNGNTMIAYCFVNKPGFSTCGIYGGNGNTDGTFCYTGFKPRMLVIKREDSTDGWFVYDDQRSPGNVTDDYLTFNGTGANTQSSAVNLDMYSHGFKLKNTDGGHNNSSGEYLYFAFGTSLSGTNDIPCTAR